MGDSKINYAKFKQLETLRCQNKRIQIAKTLRNSGTSEILEIRSQKATKKFFVIK